MATKATIGEQITLEQKRIAPDWDSGQYLNFAGRTVKHSDIVNMTNMDVARNSTMLSFAKIAGPVLRAIPTPATQAIGWVTTVASYGYDTLKLVSRMSENKSNDAFWSEYNEAVKSVNSQEGVQRIATDFAIGSNLASGQSLPANVKPIGEIAGGLGQMAQYVALGVLGGTKTFIFGGAISNAMNDANTRMGYGEEQGAAIKAGIARGVASGLTAAAFLSAWPRAVERLGGWMVDKGTGLGFVASPVTNAGLRAIEFGGWGMTEPYVLNLTRDVAGLDPLPHEDDPIATAGMFALGAMMSGGLLKKSYSFTRPRRLPSTGEKEYLNFAEMAAGKKAALKAVNETVGNRVEVGEVSAVLEAREAVYFKQLNAERIKKGEKPLDSAVIGTEPVTDKDLMRQLWKNEYGVEQRILESHGVSKKLTQPAALEKVGGPEAALRLTTGDEQAIERAMSELSTANRLIKQAKEYDLSAQSFTAERTGGKVTDAFIPDAEGVARKVRIISERDYDKVRANKYGLKIAEATIDDIKQGVGGRYNRENKTITKDYGAGESGIFTHELRHHISAEINLREIISAEPKFKMFGEGRDAGTNSKLTDDGWIPIGSAWTELEKISRSSQKDGRTAGIMTPPEIEEAVIDMTVNNNKNFISKFPDLYKKVKEKIKDMEPDLVPYKKATSVPDHIKKSVGLGSSAIVSGLIYTNLGNDQWDIKETQWLTPAVASRLAEMARNEYRISRDRQGSITKAMNVLTDDYALNPDNYKMVYDRFMKLTGGYA